MHRHPAWLGAVVCVGLGGVLACGDGADDAPATSTTTEDLSVRLLSAVDLGADYETLSSGGRAYACHVDLGNGITTAERSFTSQPALELVYSTLVRFSDADEARRSFAESRETSACAASEFGGAATPSAVEIDGADEAFGIDYADAVGSAGALVALVDDVVLVVEVELHNGDVQVEPLGSTAVAERAIDKLRA